MFVDDCGTKNPYQNNLSLWRRQNWKPVKILGREINSAAQHKQKSIGSPVHFIQNKLKKFLVTNILSLSTRIKHFAFSYNCCIFIRSPAQVYREYFLAKCLHTLCNLKWEPLIEIPNDVIFNFLLCFQSLFDIFLQSFTQRACLVNVHFANCYQIHLCAKWSH